MFRKYYKEANDDIKPNRALIDTIFENAEKSEKSAVRTKVYRYGTLAAAVLILAVSVYSYPQIVRFADSGKEIIDEIAPLTNDNKTKENALYESRDSSIDEGTADSEAADENVNSQSRSGVTDDGKKSTDTGTAEKNALDKTSDKDGQNAAATKTENKTEDTDDYAGIIGRESVSEDDSLENSVSGLASTMTAEYKMPLEDSDLQKGGGAVSSRGVAIWSMENYYDYLGTDICEKISIPQDMKNITPSEMYFQTENGVPVDDSVVFIFYANENRNIYLTTRKKKHEEYDTADNTSFDETHDDVYTIETKAADIYFDVFARGITETELNILMKSISEINE